MSAPVSDDRVLRETRLTGAVVAPLLFVAFAVLTFWPDNTQQLFAWTISPSMTALLLGAGYFSGAYLTARVSLARQWHHVAIAVPSLTAFVWLTALATVLHWDRFNHGHIMFVIWVIVYAVTPFAMPLLWVRNRSADPGIPDANDAVLPRAVRAVMAVAGAAELAIGVWMFVLPDSAIGLWPWRLTPLTARVLAAWFVMPGLSALLIARDARWSASRVLVQGGALLAGLILIGIVRARSDFDSANPLTYIYAALIVVTLIGLVALYAGMEARRRSSFSLDAFIETE